MPAENHQYMVESCDTNKVTIMTHKIDDKQACTNKDNLSKIYIIFYNNKCNSSFQQSRHKPSDQHATQESNKGSQVP